MLTSDIGNYPGFVEDIKGPELIKKMIDQAKRFGAKIVFEDVSAVDFSKRPLLVRTENQEYQAEAVIIATGASAKWLGLSSETRLRGRGVSGCATCDGFFFKDKKVVVIGGGDAAIEEATYLAKFATEVIVIHRRDSLRASKIMQSRAQANPKIKFIWNSEVVEILGDEKVEGIKIKNLLTGKETEIPTDGVFVAIGHEPSTKFLAASGIELDQKGYVMSRGQSRTNIEGVFVAGDVEDHIYRQAVTAAAAGCRAALEAEWWLEKHES